MKGRENVNEWGGRRDEGKTEREKRIQSDEGEVKRWK